MKHLLKTMVLAALISMGSMYAFAEDSAPTASDADEFIRDAMLSLKVVPDSSTLRTYFTNYRSLGCEFSISSVWPDNPELWIDHDSTWKWESIYKVGRRDYRNVVYILGPIEFSGKNVSDGKYGTSRTYIDFKSDSPVTANRLFNAMTLLMNSCKKKSKFD